MILHSIETPADIKGLSYEELDELCTEIRNFIVDTVTTTGGHLGSNLGAVELTLALHRVFDSPRDVLLWDTGHQAYVHKLLTGRRYGFKNLRMAGGMSGYPNRAESEHDWIENSHASTALSYAHGISSGFAVRGVGAERRVVAVVGDGALTGGMAYEALNNLGHSRRRVVIVLNDNGRSYAPTVSQLSQSLTSLRLNPTYTAARERLRLRLRELPAFGELAYSSVHSLTSALREMVAPHTFFEALGVRYAGPIDGHDIEHMEQAFTHAAEWDGPIVVHVLTQKGRGYAPAEEDEVQRLHDVKATQAVALENTVGSSAGRAVGGSAGSDSGGLASPGSVPETAVDEALPRAVTYTDAFSRALLAVASEDPRVVALDRGDARAHGAAPLPGPLPGPLLRRGYRRAARGDVGRGHGHGRLAARGGGVLDVLVASLRPGQPRRRSPRLPGRLRARPGRDHRRRRAVAPRRARPGAGTVHPRHDGVRAVERRGGGAHAADGAGDCRVRPPSGCPRPRRGTWRLTTSGAGSRPGSSAPATGPSACSASARPWVRASTPPTSWPPRGSRRRSGTCEWCVRPTSRCSPTRPSIGWS